MPSPVERLFEAARTGDLFTLANLLDSAPGLLQSRAEPYAWTLLHTAAHHGQLAAVELLLERGIDPNVREKGDNTYPMHWAAAAGHLEIVRRLADAGGDVTGQGDDHQLEVIGWACCWPGGDDARHRAVVDFLVSRGARHHIFSAIALDLGDELRRIFVADPTVLERPMSHNEDFQRPLHFAVRMKRPDMVALLLKLGADPRGTDGSGLTAIRYASSPELARPLVQEALGRGEPLDLPMALALHDWAAADRLAAGAAVEESGALHLMAGRNDVAALRWLLRHGADPNGRWLFAGASVTPLHMAARHDHREAARLLLAAGADPHIPDSMHNSDPIGWAEYFGFDSLAETLRGGGAAPQLHPGAADT